MGKLLLALLFAVLLVVVYLTSPRALEWIRWDGWSLYF